MARKKEDVVAVGIISDNDGVKEDDGDIYANDKRSTDIRSRMKIKFYWNWIILFKQENLNTRN